MSRRAAAFQRACDTAPWTKARMPYSKWAARRSERFEDQRAIDTLKTMYATAWQKPAWEPVHCYWTAYGQEYLRFMALPMPGDRVAMWSPETGVTVKSASHISKKHLRMIGGSSSDAIAAAIMRRALLSGLQVQLYVTHPLEKLLAGKRQI